MKKRLFCLALCLMMILPSVLMAGCSAETEDGTTTTTSYAYDTKAMTLTLYSIKGEGTTDEAIQLAQAAINKITEPKFNTHIVLRLYEEDEYYGVIEDKIQAIEDRLAYEDKVDAARRAANKAARAAGVTTTPETTIAPEDITVETDETVINEYGLEKTVYPEVSENQLDIFLITNVEKYKEYIDREVILVLDEELSINSKILKDYIHPTFLSSVEIDRDTYAVPNNHMVGEYQYFLLNRELFDKYYFDPSSIITIENLEEFILTVAEKEKGVTPIIDTFGVETYVYYPTAEKTVLGGYKTGVITPEISVPLTNIFKQRAYQKSESLLYDWEKAGYLVEDDSLEGKNFAVGMVSGSYADVQKYEEDYYIVTYKNAAFSNENVYESMYAVGAYTKNVSRCMEIIEYLTINEELRNTFQYGMEGVHYEIDEHTGIVNIISDEYNMNPLYTGNQFKLWPNNQMSEVELALAENNWELGKLHNFNAGINPYLTFIFDDVPEGEENIVTEKDDKGNKVTVKYMTCKEIMDGIIEVSGKYFDMIDDDFEPFEYEQEYSTMVLDPETGETVESVGYKKVKCNTRNDYIAYIGYLAGRDKYIDAADDPNNELAPATQYKLWHEALYPSQG